MVQKQSARKNIGQCRQKSQKLSYGKNCYNFVYLTNCFHKIDPTEEKEVILVFICVGIPPLEDIA